MLGVDERADPAAALRLTVNGVTVALGPGLTAHVAYDADGVPRVIIPPPG